LVCQALVSAQLPDSKRLLYSIKPQKVKITQVDNDMLADFDKNGKSGNASGSGNGRYLIYVCFCLYVWCLCVSMF
jgi:hypothetical protein